MVHLLTARSNDQPLQVQGSLHHFNNCAISTQSSHVEQCGNDSSRDELHFHSFQPSLYEFAIGGVCQQLVQVLLHSGLGLRSFLTQHVHILEDERCLLESNDVMNVCDTITLLNAQLQQ